MRLATQLIVAPALVAVIAVGGLVAEGVLTAQRVDDIQAQSSQLSKRQQALEAIRVELASLHARAYRTMALIASLEGRSRESIWRIRRPSRPRVRRSRRPRSRSIAAATLRCPR